MSSRFPGYMEVRGRDRARLARWLGWPHGEARRDRRSLALESGLWLVALVIGAGVLARRRGAADVGGAAVALSGWAALGLAGIAAIGSHATLDAATGGPTLLALALLALAPTSDHSTAWVWPLAGLLALLAASPLAGTGDALALLDATVDPLVVGLGLGWSTSRAIAGGLAVLALAAGLGACVGPLLEPREARRGPAEAIRFALALAVAVALALRKPADDLALLSVGCVLFLAASIQFGGRRPGVPRLSGSVPPVIIPTHRPDPPTGPP